MEANKYFVVKDKNDFSITFFEYDKVKGYNMQPKNVKIKDAIDVKSMIFINPSMIQKLAFRKVDARYQKLLKFLMFVLSADNDDVTGDTYRQALNEINKLRLEILVYYKEKLKENDFVEFNKRLDLFAQEINARMYYLQSLYEKTENYDIGKKSR